VQFERRPSQRYARRQSHILRERQRDRDHPDSRKSIKQAKERDTPDAILNDEPKVSKPRSQASTPNDGRMSLSPPVTPTSRSTPSPTSTSRLDSTTTPSPPDDPLDNLIKSIAKENGALHTADVHSQPSSLEVDINVVPNNQSKYVSLPRPIPPDKLKCNILKAKVEEDLKKTSSAESNGFQSLSNG